MESHYPIFEKPFMCQYCKNYTVTPHWVSKEFHRSTMQFAFCNEDHAEKFYLDFQKNIRAGL